MNKGRDFWAAHVAAWRRSGMSLRAYSAGQGVAKGTLGYWSSKLRREGRGGELVELPPARTASWSADAARPIELVVEGRYLLRLWPGTAKGDIREVVTALEQRS